MKLLQVQDNGRGIHHDDLRVLCRRHTTSKLAAFDDLQKISTLGFRGEALASLSYVSILTVTTKRKADNHAWRGSFDSSEMKEEASPCAGVDGTTVTVEDLFYNAPMRKKGLKSASEEYNMLLDVVQRYAVYHAGTSISLRRVGTTRIDVHTRRGASRRDTIRNVYGTDVSANLSPFERSMTVPYAGSDIGVVTDAPGTTLTPGSPSRHHLINEINGTDEIKLEGFLTGPGYSSTKRTKLVLFINGRCVESPVLRRCIDGVYSVLLPKGVKPFVFLSITMPLEWVDVNVHPTKSEVAMLHEEAVADCLREAVEATLLAHEDTRTVRVQTSLTTLMPALTTAPATRPTQVPSPEKPPQSKPTKPTKPTSAYKRPDKLVRVDPSSQTLQQLLSAPSRKNRRTSVMLDLSIGARDTHEGLREILHDNVMVGWVDAERLLLQKATKLYLLDVGELSRDLFVQMALSSSDSARLTLRPPASVSELLLIALSALDGDAAPLPSTTTPTLEVHEEVTGLLRELLARHAGWLEATFGIVVSADGDRLVQLPDLGPRGAHASSSVALDTSRLPDFVLALAAEVDWTDVELRRPGVAGALAELFRLREGDDEERSRAVWEEVKASLVPERRRATDGSVVELTRLEQLYRTFERC